MKKQKLESEYDKIDAQEEKVLTQNEEIKRLIASSNKMHKVLKIGDVEIRIRAYMPRSIRLKFLRVANIIKRAESDEEIFEADKLIYPIIAEMCLDPPFNKASTWQLIDNETGAAQKFLVDMMEVINSTEKQIETFRTE